MESEKAIQSVYDHLRQGHLLAAMQLLQENRKEAWAQVLLREWLIGEGRNDQVMDLLNALSNDFTAEAHVSRSIAALLAGDLRQAERECRTALRMEPRSATAHNHLGRALHNLGHGEQALQAFQAATQLQPDYVQAWYNLGHALRAQGRMPEAANAYREALARAPEFRAALLNLGITLSLMEKHEEALACFQSLLQLAPDHTEALVNGGLCLHVLGKLLISREYYERALTLQPDHATAHCYLGILRNELMDTEGAIESLTRALKLNPQDIEARVELAGVYEQTNQLELARQVIGPGLAADPWHPALRLEAAKLARRGKKIGEALEILRALKPDHLPARQAQQYYFELGQALDRAGDFPGAYRAFQTGNELISRSPRRSRINPEGFAQRCDSIASWLAEGAPGGRATTEEMQGDTGGDLCFLLGFPRSGTTLLDTFLNAHPDIGSIEEHPTLERVIDELRRDNQPYTASLPQLTPDDVFSLRALYRQELKRYQAQSPKLVLDKLPLRSINAGLINRLFPHAKILFALRHPCDVVLSNFMQQYAENEAFIHFDTLGDSAAMYDRVLSLWHRIESTLSPNLLYTRYEDLVRDPQKELNRVCAFLGVAPTDGMMDLKKRLDARDRVRTNSYQQVAEPVYQRSVNRWKNYEEYLAPVLPVLEPYIKRFGFDA